MERYWRWYQDGYWSATGSCFDIGNTVREALHRFRQSGEPFSGSTDPHRAGNGCIMRLGPVALYYYPHREKAVFYAGQSAKTTHRAAECVEACRLLADLLVRALDGENKDNLLRTESERIKSPLLAIRSEKIAAIARGDYLQKPVERIRGSGYVVESLEAALYCFARTESFEAAVLMAANLGDDADTTAAVCGQIAGAYYGESGIPRPWLEKLAMAERIRALGRALMSGPAPEKEPPSQNVP